MAFGGAAAGQGVLFGEGHEQIMPYVQKQNLPAERGPASVPGPCSCMPLFVLTDSDESGTIPVRQFVQLMYS